MAIGDGRQLSSIGAGGMFDRLAAELPSAELRTVHRTQDPGEQDAWTALRNGDARVALSFYQERGAVHLADTRDDAIEHAARAYDRHAAEFGHAHVALMSDASNVEIDHLNLRVQALRRQRDELGREHVEHPDGYPLHAGDRVIWTRPMPVRGGPRVENGQRGEVVDLGDDRLGVQLDGGDRIVTVGGDRLDARRDSATPRTSCVSRARPSDARSSSRAAGRPPRRPPTSEAARGGVEWHIGRDDLDGHDDAGRLDHLAERMSVSRAQEPSLSVELHDPRRLPDDPRNAFAVAPLRPAAAPDLIPDTTPDHGHDLAMDR